MIEPDPDLARSSPSLADRLDELAARWRDVLAASSDPAAPAKLRAEVLALRDELAEAAPRLARVLDRLAVMTEVWECLAGDTPEAADEVGLFGARGLAQLARAERSGGASDAMLHLLLEQSGSTWGEYLALLEPPEPEPDRERHDPLEEMEADTDEPPAIDAQALLRLFCGIAPEPDAPEPAPAPPPRPRAAPPPPVAAPAPPPRLKAASPPPPEREPAATCEIPPLPRQIELDDEIREAFLADATELFERIQTLVLGLAGSSNLGRDLAELRRALHTLKGAAGAVGLSDLAMLVHGLEEEIESAGARIGDGLEDRLHGMLGYLEGILDLLHRKAPAPAANAVTTVAEAPVERPVEAALAPLPSTPEVAAIEAADEGPVRVPAARFDDLMDMVSELIVRRRLWTSHAETLKAITTMVRSCRGRMLGALDRLHEAGLGREDRVGRFHPGADLPGQLRRLGELADDLAVLAESARSASLPLADHGDAMGRLSLQLWDELQAIRIVPVRGLFQRLARVAHEAARVEGRRVDVVMTGEETGVDRAVQDKAFEPLLHIVRNAVGHGIEDPAERAQAGKPAAGRITIEARREGNTLVLSVADDGRGLDLTAIEAKARRVGLLAPDERPGPDRLRNLIFHPGFSTRAQANAISGRGVGMDVVAREVASLKGTIELASEPRKGTRLTIRLPARLALEPAMIVRVDGQAFAVPVAQIEHAQPLGGDGAEVEDGTDGVLRFRDQSIPVLRAREILGLADTAEPAWPKLLVVRHGGGLVGLVVDSIEGTEDLVIKPLGALLTGHPLISGTSLSLGGEVITVLDASRLQRWVRGGPPQAGAARTTPGRGAPAVLVVDDSISVRKVLAKGLLAMRLDVDEVSDGLEALSRLRGRAYDLVVTDLEMPRLDGFELVAEMQRVAGLARIPVIVASTRVDEETRRRVLALGARQFLAKPVDPEALAAAVTPLVSGARDGARRLEFVEQP